MNEKAKPCPFCGWENIRVIESIKEDEPLKDAPFTFCWCKSCGSRGPWAYNVDEDEKEIFKKCISR